MQILRTIAFIIIFYYVFKFLGRIVLPFFITRWANKKMDEFQKNSHNQFKSQEEAKQFTKQHEGEVKITSKKNTKTESDGLGDYVDYEEVD